MQRKICTLHICHLTPFTDLQFHLNPNRGIQTHHQEHQNLGAEFSISSKKHQFLKHQRRGGQQSPTIGEKSECERNFNIASKTACRGFKSFCPCHRHGSLQTPTFRRLRAFSMPKSSEWTRSIDTGFPWQNPPNAPIFVNIPTTAVWYIIKKASANFRKRTVLYCVPRRGLTEKKNASFLFNLVVMITDDLLDCGGQVW